MQIKDIERLRSGTFIKGKDATYMIIGIQLEKDKCTRQEYILAIKQKSLFTYNMIKGDNVSTLDFSKSYKKHFTELEEGYEIVGQISDVPLILTKIKMMMPDAKVNDFKPYHVRPLTLSSTLDVTDWALHMNYGIAPYFFSVPFYDTAPYKIMMQLDKIEGEDEEEYLGVTASFYFTWNGYYVLRKKRYIQKLNKFLVAEDAVLLGKMTVMHEVTPYKEHLNEILNKLLDAYLVDYKLTDEQLCQKYPREVAKAFCLFAAQNSKDKVELLKNFLDTMRLGYYYLLYKEVGVKQSKGYVTIKGKDFEKVKKIVKHMPVRGLMFQPKTFGNEAFYFDFILGKR